MRRDLQRACHIIKATNGGRRWRDGDLSGQRAGAQRSHGLCAAPCDGQTCGHPPPAGAVSACGAAGRGLRGGGLFAGAGVFVSLPRKTGGRGFDGAHRLRGRGASGAAGAAVLSDLLCAGGVRACAGTAGGRRCARPKRHLLHGCGRAGAAGVGHGVVSCFDGGVPGGGSPRHRRGAAERDRLRGRENGTADGPAGHGKRPAGRLRRRGAGGISGVSWRRAARRGRRAFDAGAAAVSGGSCGAGAGGGTGAEALPFALPGGGNRRRAAAGGADGLGGGRRQAVRGRDGGSVADEAGRWLCRAVGRRNGKERKV